MGYVAITRLLPMSPADLLRRQRSSEADAVMVRVGGPGQDVQDQLAAMKENLAGVSSTPSLTVLRGSRFGLKPIVWIGVLLAAFQQLVGINVVKTYSNTLWQVVGFSTDASFQISIFTVGVSIASTVVAILVMDRIGRKTLLVAGAAVMVVSLGTLTVCFSSATPTGAEGDLAIGQGAAIAALIAINLFAIGFGVTWGPVMWLMLGELFDSSTRTMAVALATAVNWLTNWAVTFTFPMLAGVGLGFAYGFYTAFAVLALSSRCGYCLKRRTRFLTDLGGQCQTQVRSLVVLGATGDLSARLLLPGLASLVANGEAPGLRLVGAGTSDWSEQQWRDQVEESFAATTVQSEAMGRAALEQMLKSTTYRKIDVMAPGALAGLVGSVESPVALYFALPPVVTQEACELLTPADLPAGTRLVLEKPFGTSQESARALNSTLAALVPEDQVFRVDHWLATPTVVNVLGLRFANPLLEPVWSGRFVDKVEIIFDEDLTLEGRAGYYNSTGALRDMIQSHLLLVMAVVAMEAPATLGHRDVRDAIAAVLRAAGIDDDHPRSTRRARYTAGTIGDRWVPNYVDETGVDRDGTTETLAEVEVRIENWRWAGVPFVLRSGKSLARYHKEAIITFKPVPHLPAGFAGQQSPARIRIGFAPEVLGIEFDANSPGDVFSLDRAVLRTQLVESDLLPYGQVLKGVLTGDPLLFVRGDAAVECWRIAEPTLAAWAEDVVPLQDYPAGSNGPESWTTSRKERTPK